MSKGKDSSKVALGIIGIFFFVFGIALFLGFYLGITKKIQEANRKIIKQ